MKKRVYHTSFKRQKLMHDALDAAREARKAIDPSLLARVRDAIGEAAERQQTEQNRAMQAERVPVDRKKNLSIVMKYLELNPHNQALRHEVSAFLAGQ